MFFLDDDDEILDGYCAKILSDKVQAQAAFGFSARQFQTSSTIGERTLRTEKRSLRNGLIGPKAGFKERTVPFSAGFWTKKETFKTIGPIATGLRTNSDTEYTCRLFASGTPGWYSETPGVRIYEAEERALGETQNVTKRTRSSDRADAFYKIAIENADFLSEDISAARFISTRLVKHSARAGSTGQAFVAAKKSDHGLPGSSYLCTLRPRRYVAILASSRGHLYYSLKRKMNGVVVGKSLRDRLVKKTQKWATAADPATCVRRLTYAKGILRFPTEVTHSDELYLIEDGNDRIFTARSARLPRVIWGIDRRLDILRKEYLIEPNMVRPGDIVVDCGANIGEFSVICAKEGARVFAFEPDPREFSALQANADTYDFTAFNYALWHSDEELTFYDANESGDSSLINPGTSVQEIKVAAAALDSFPEFPDKPVRLVKLEAEGAEPEIIQGMSNVLQRTDYVTVDMGPERGLAKENTVAEVTDALYNLGFRLVRFSTVRMVGLFEARRHETGIP